MNTRFIATLVSLLTFTFFSCNIVTDNSVEENDGKTSFDGRVDSLMQLMTIEEKIGQTVMYSGSGAVTGPTVNTKYREYIKEANVGAMLNVYSAKGTRDLQKLAVEETRLGIPLLFGYDVIHGFKTIFPINLGLAASWDLEDIEKSSRIAAEEASAEGIHWTFAPMVDISREPRWGRISEGAGEDVLLGSEIAKAYVRGFQGEDLSKNNTILACAKHFVGYGAAQAGRDYHTVNMSEGELRNVFLPPFKASIDAGVETFMTAFNEVNGVPATGNSFLYRDILRDEWGFKGFVVSDYTAIFEMVKHGFAADFKHSAKIAMNAGIDMDMMAEVNRLYLKELIDEGKVDVAYVEDACRRILLTKFKLGLFDDPYRYCDEQREKETIYKAEFLDAARHSAARSSVLLKNSNMALPLNKKQSIALIGPLAKDKENILGNWGGAGDRKGKAISMYQGIKEYLPESRINYSKGCEIEGNDESKFNEAILMAQKSDIVVMVMGEDYDMSGEAASRTDIKLPGCQTKLIRRIRKAVPDKKIVLVLMNGRPLDLSEEDMLADAILEAWFPGTMGGSGVSDVLFGEYNPSGKLTVTFPRNLGQIPIYYNMKNTGRPIPSDNPKEDYKSNYIDSPNTPLYPFGHGLSYTTFDYSDFNLSSSSIGFSDTLSASTTITNLGDFDGHEIVQLYIHDKVGSVTRPVKELKGFKKIFLKKGESKTVRFDLTHEDLKFYNSKMEFTVETGEFEIAIENTSHFDFKYGFTLK